MPDDDDVQTDEQLLEQLALAATELAQRRLNSLSPAARKTLAEFLEKSSLSMIVDLHPQFGVCLAVNPDDPNVAAFELARLVLPMPDEIKRMLH